MSFCIHKSNVALCNNESIILYNFEDDSENVIHLPDIVTNKKIDVHNNIDIEAHHMITSILFSQDGKYFLVCTNRKQLCLYDTKSKKLLSNRTLTRAASKVKFAPNNDIVIADKAGDVYLFDSNSLAKEGTLLLGHLSMLLDVLITEDGKYILTTDRDEKIRVSMFPNSYNIVTYCLGHTKFVTNISLLPHDKRILVSAGGDGELILWDYICGQKLLSKNFCQYMPKDDIYKLNKDLESCHLETSTVLPVKHLSLSKSVDNESLLVISFHCSEILLIYNMQGTMELGLTATFVELIKLSSEPLECLLYEQNLWILTNTGFQFYEFENDNFKPNGTTSSKLSCLNNYWKSLKNDICIPKFFPVLYKRKFDNVQEYLGRKKTRLANVTQ